MTDRSRQVLFLVIFFIGLALFSWEEHQHRLTRFLPVAGRCIFPSYLVLWLIMNRRMWPAQRRSYIIGSFRTALLASFTTMLFLPTISGLVELSSSRGQKVQVHNIP